MGLGSGVGTVLAPILTSSRKNTLRIAQVKENKKAAIGIYASLTLLDLSDSTDLVEAFKQL
jgi:hypothetical protein